jgi:transposase
VYAVSKVERIKRAILLKGTQSERADDLPLIIHWLKQMEIASIIDRELPPPHGNRKGLSYGQLSVLFLSYVVSQSDHRLCAVEPWVENHRKTLEMATGWNIGVKDATDDRLADLLSMIGSSKQQERENIALRLGQKTIRAYELPTDKARSDTTSFSVYHQPRTETESENLINFGYSKDHRPDLVQYRQMLATLDPMGLPLLGATLPGNKTDESDYLPTWRQLAKIIGHKDFLFLADSKASTWNNRGSINHEGGIYCFPLAMVKPRPKLLSQWIADSPTPVSEIYLNGEEDSEDPIGEGFEVPLGSLWWSQETQQGYRWAERWLVVCSYALQQRQLKSLWARLSKAELALEKLAQKPPQDEVILQTKVESILKRYRVKEQILTSIEKKISYQKVYQGAGRGGENRASRRVRQTTLSLTYQRCPAKISQQQSIAGWRIYVTNAEESHLSLEQAVNSYREQWQPERGFHRFKRGRLPALPIYFQDEERIRGLMFLLTIARSALAEPIALTLFTLMEFVVRRQLTQSQQSLSGLYSGNPKRTTFRPTTEQLLAAFSELTLYLYPDGSTELSSLNSLQRQILLLMKIPESIYFVPQLVPD